MKARKSAWFLAIVTGVVATLTSSLCVAEEKYPEKAEIDRLTKLGKELTPALTKKQREELCLQVAPAPDEFAYVLATGYGKSDNYPKTVDEFEGLIVNMKNAGYNTLYGVYREWRVPILRKHGVKLMIDILAWGPDAQHDIRDPRMWQRPRVKEICEKVRNDRAVWGYNLWNETLDHYFRSGGDMNFHHALIKKWDGTHPIWIGTKYSKSLGWMWGNPGVVAWYDYHWRRGFGFHYGHCSIYAKFAEERRSFMGRWLHVYSYNQNMYTLNTTIAHGLKVCMWFIGQVWHERDQKWNDNHHFVRIGREMKSLWPELAKIGRPVCHKEDGKIKSIEVFSTPEIDPKTRQPRIDAKTKKVKIIGGWRAFPEDHWCQAKSGSVVAGFFKYPDGDDAIYVASHDAGKPMKVSLDFSNRAKKGEKFVVGFFDRKTGKWNQMKLTGNCAAFDLAIAGGELLSVGPKLRRSRKTLEELGKCTGDVDWAEYALQVAWDLEGPGLEKSVTLYQQITAKYTGKKQAEKAKKRLALLEPRLKDEKAAWADYQKLLTLSGKLKEGSVDKAIGEKLLAGTKALYARFPTTMGAARARALCEKFKLADWL
ncbi:MAG: hypothetical protein QGH60_15275 [Phycisphaerae bacterium]|jgi:hypothetical protein|nr:hypothetical protein [Phycisphaerae bacterium]